MARVEKPWHEWKRRGTSFEWHECLSRGTSGKAVARVKKSWHELITGTSGTTGTSVKAVAVKGPSGERTGV